MPPRLLLCPLLLLLASSRCAGGGPLLPGATLLDTRISGPTGSCHILYVRPALSKEACLHISLCGRGTRTIARRATCELARAFERAERVHRCRCGACVVSMSASEGAALLSLPIIAQFILAHRRHLHHVVVLEAKGMAYSAVQVVKQLSSHDAIRMFRSIGDFASHAAVDGDSDFRARDRMALQLARRACAASTDAAAPRWRLWSAGGSLHAWQGSLHAWQGSLHACMHTWWQQTSLAARRAVRSGDSAQRSVA